MINFFSWSYLLHISLQWNVCLLPIVWLDFFNCQVSRSLYILDTNPLSDVSFANIFSDLVACPFIPLNRGFCRAKVLNLMRSNLSVFPLRDCIFGVKYKNSLQSSRSQRFSPMFAPERFLVFHFTCKSILHFKLIFVWRVRFRLKFIFFILPVDSQLLQCCWLKRLSFLYGIAFSSLLKISWVGLPWWHSGWESTCQCRGHGFEPWSGRSHMSRSN